MNIQRHLEGKILGINNAHPDDHIPHAHLLWKAHVLGVPVHELVQTKGKAGKNLREGEHPVFSVKRGDRVKEGRASAKHMGIASYTQYDGQDGELAKREKSVAQITAAWVKSKGINVLATLATGDHADHDTTVRSSRLAAAALWQEGYALDLLELQPKGTHREGDIVAEATPDSMELAFTAAALNPSQFETFSGIQEDWPIVGGLSMEPDSFEGLRQYPILEDAAYRLIPAGELLVAEATLVAPGVR